jgi:hypothetical protein
MANETQKRNTKRQINRLAAKVTGPINTWEAPSDARHVRRMARDVMKVAYVKGLRDAVSLLDSRMRRNPRLTKEIMALAANV